MEEIRNDERFGRAAYEFAIAMALEGVSALGGRAETMHAEAVHRCECLVEDIAFDHDADASEVMAEVAATAAQM